MSQPWYSVYVPTTAADTVAQALQSVLVARGFTPYDPFPGGTGTLTGMSDSVRQFVAPAQEGWVRVLGQPHEDALADFGEEVKLPILYAWLTEQDGGFALFREGQRHETPAAFELFLRPDHTMDELHSAFEGKLEVDVIESSEGDSGENVLPSDLRQFAQQKGVDDKKASKVVERLSASLFGKLGGEGSDQDQARAVFAGGGRDPWNSLAGQRVRAIAGLLRFPANWRTPAWDTVREAYQIYRLQERNPRMALMPGDRESMKAVPNALRYTPVYLGKV
ncbi:MAG: hypothetical protein HY866_01575 [Chloroflexi bacterium]|nr:hypothetical protein [Chloroflexota bacterium]